MQDEKNNPINPDPPSDTGGLADITKLAGKVPEVNTRAVEAHKARTGKETSDAKFEALKDAAPKKKRGRPPKNKKAEEKKTVGGMPVNKDGLVEMGSREAALLLLQIETGTLKGIFGDDAWLMNEVELATNVEALAAALDASGGVKLSPWQAAMLMQVTYFAGRMTLPSSRKKLAPKIGLLKAWLKLKISNRRNKKDAKKEQKQNDTRSNSGDNTKREDNPSGETGATGGN